MSSPQDTPTKYRIASLNPSYHDGSLEDSRHIFLQDAPEIAEVRLESFLSIITPTSLPFNDEILYRRLVAIGAVSEDDSGWTCMAADPTSNSEHEGKAFAPLQKIFKQVISAANLKKPLIKLDLNGPKSLESEPKNKSRPDAYIQLSERSFDKQDSAEDYWVDVVAPIEFKKELNDVTTLDVSAFVLVPVQTLIAQ